MIALLAEAAWRSSIAKTSLDLAHGLGSTPSLDASLIRLAGTDA
jgi:hypothetical protein